MENNLIKIEIKNGYFKYINKDSIRYAKKIVELKNKLRECTSQKDILFINSEIECQVKLSFDQSILEIVEYIHRGIL